MSTPPTITKVIVAGISGNLGLPLITALISSGFQVSALTRVNSTSGTTSSTILPLPPSVPIYTTDYTHTSLLPILKGHDAIISTLATSSIVQQRILIDAAAEAGITRFLPSEFGNDTARAREFRELTAANTKRDVVEYLMKKEMESGMSWTAICGGAWFDWGLETGFLHYDIPHRKATIFDDGDRKFEVTNVSQIVNTIIAALQHPNETANQYVYVNSFSVTQNEILAALERATDSKWEVQRKSLQEFGEASLGRIEASVEKTGGGRGSEGGLPDGIYDLILAAFYGFVRGGGRSLNDFEGRAKVWKEKLGLSEETLEDIVEEVAKRCV